MRLTRCKGFLKRFGTGDIDRMLFTDEKIFTVEEATNKQNDRILSKNTQSIPESAKVVDRTHHRLGWGACRITDRFDICAQGGKN